MALFAELRRRNVFKVALLYAVSSWLIVWFVQNTGEVLGLPSWTDRFLMLLLMIGFPVALLFAWTYEITPSGLRKAVDVEQTQSIVYKTGQKLNAAVAVLLVLGVLAVIGEGLLPKFEFLVPGVPEGDAPSSENTPPEIRSLTLDNGLKIIVWPEQDTTDVVMYTFVRVGGRNEHPGITGFSRFIERLMVLGADDHEPGEFARAIAATGGSSNAYTSNDMTVYQDWFPSSALDIVFELEATRFDRLQADVQTISIERHVALQEQRAAIDTDAWSKLYDQMHAAAFIAHPYRLPVFGWPSDMAAWSEQELVDFQRTYYAANNRIVVIAGNVVPAAVFALAEEHFAAAEAQEPPLPVRTIEPAQQGVRRFVIAADAETPLLQIAFHAGSATDPQTLPMNLLLNILAGGESSRLHRALVENEQLVLDVGAAQDEGFDPGLVYFYLTLPAVGDAALVEQRVLEELQRVAAEGVTEAEMESARSRALEDLQLSLAVIDGRASAIGRFETYRGDFEAVFDHPGNIEAVGIDELRDAAAAVFRVENMTVGVLRDGAAAP